MIERHTLAGGPRFGLGWFDGDFEVYFYKTIFVFRLRNGQTSDTLETATNAILGITLSWLITYCVLPIVWDIHPTAQAATGITFLFFVVSTARQYALRKLFRKLEKG